MDPVVALNAYIARHQAEEKKMGEELAEIDVDIERAIEDVAAAQANLKRLVNGKTVCLKTLSEKRSEHAKKMNEVHERSSSGGADPKKRKLNEKAAAVANKKKKYEMLERFEQSKMPMMTTDDIKTRLEGLAFTAEQLHQKTGLCDKKCKGIAELDLGHEYPQTRKILSQMIYDVDGSTPLQPAVPSPTP